MRERRTRSRPAVEAYRYLPGGCSTSAKSPLRHALPFTPRICVAGAGGSFEDDIGRRWLDFDMALSAAILGHAHSAVNRAVVRQISFGVSYSIPSILEGRLAERMVERFPAVEAVRFAKDGSDATTGAVRLARRATGRDEVVIGAYHGWHDWSAVGYYGADGLPPHVLGVPNATASTTVWLHEETLSSLEKQVPSLRDVAAVVVCPENWEPENLARLLERCRAAGSVVIFDEIKSGLRFGPRGVHGALGLTPDLVCLGKSLANGFPLALLGGRLDLLDNVDEIRFSTTGGSEAVALAAALAVDEEIRDDGAWPPWNASAGELMRRLRLLCQEEVPRDLAISGYPGNFRVHTPGLIPRRDPFRRTLLVTLAARDIFSSGFVLPCSEHTKEDFRRLEEALEAAILAWQEDGGPPVDGEPTVEESLTP